MRVQRGHVDVGHIGVAHAQALDDFAVDRGATAVADKVQRRLEQLTTGLDVQVSQRGIQRIGRRFGKARIADVGLFVPIRDQHHRLAGFQRRCAAQAGLRVKPDAGVLVVRQHHAAATGVGDQLGQLQERGGLLVGQVGQALRRIELEAVGQDGDPVVRRTGGHRRGHKAGGLGKGIARRDQAHAPVVALAGGKFQR